LYINIQVKNRMGGANMYPIPWYAIILIGLPSNFLTISIGARLFNINISIQKRVIISIIIGILLYFTRHLTIPGLNSIALIISTALLLRIISRLTLWKAFLTIVLGFVVLAIIETLCNSIIFSLFHLNFGILAARPWINILSFLPTIAVASLLYWLISRKNVILYNLSQYEDHAK